jgi:protein-L-isoaspartate O-methyltransferase
VDQLEDNGILLIPVGSGYLQKMIRARKAKGKLETENLGDYVFVPLTGEYGQ